MLPFASSAVVTRAQLKAELDVLKTALAPLVAAVVLNPMTDDDDKAEIQRRWAALNDPTEEI